MGQERTTLPQGGSAVRTSPVFSSWASEGQCEVTTCAVITLSFLDRGGKSSIQKVVFHKLSPNETLFLESTSKVVKDDINNSSFVQFQV